MRKIQWMKLARSWWGRLLVGAILGALLIGFSGIQQPTAYLIGMIVGALVLFFLGRWE